MFPLLRRDPIMRALRLRTVRRVSAAQVCCCPGLQDRKTVGMTMGKGDDDGFVCKLFDQDLK